jgi:hypothetical protein
LPIGARVAPALATGMNAARSVYQGGTAHFLNADAQSNPYPLL